VLPPTRGSARREILAAIENLRAGGSTNGGEGLRLAYATARRRFVEGGINRVILATDGDFNVGITDRGELIRFVEDQAREGVFLTVLGFGMGNYKDDRLEQLADRGNGNYAYIDSPREAHKALVEQIGGTLITIAKDVKIQVEFNPAEVEAYRLIGYENRLLRREDFNDDRKDAGEIGSGHTVTALYEIVPRGEPMRLPAVDPLKYQTEPESSRASASGEVFTVKLRYKDPDGTRSRLIEHPVSDGQSGIRNASDDLRFAAAVAAFGMILRGSEQSGEADHDLVLSLARDAIGEDVGGHRREFLQIVREAAGLASRGSRR
jgi:Ca-activated chloride channel family protein